MAECECDYDPAFHKAKNARLGIDDSKCHQPPAVHEGVETSPALCMGCLFGCAE